MKWIREYNAFMCVCIVVVAFGPARYIFSCLLSSTLFSLDLAPPPTPLYFCVLIIRLDTNRNMCSLFTQTYSTLPYFHVLFY